MLIIAKSGTTAFIGGPKIFVRKLRYPYPQLKSWIKVHRTNIGKVARRMIHIFPPECGSRVSLSVTEFVTEVWRTLFVETAGPIMVAFISTSDGNTGAWEVVQAPNLNGLSVAGFSSCAVLSQIHEALTTQQDGTEWCIASEGIPVEIPSNVVSWFTSCFVSSVADEHEPTDRNDPNEHNGGSGENRRLSTE
jgi:hypothetical protein